MLEVLSALDGLFYFQSLLLFSGGLWILSKGCILKDSLFFLNDKVFSLICNEDMVYIDIVI